MEFQIRNVFLRMASLKSQPDIKCKPNRHAQSSSRASSLLILSDTAIPALASISRIYRLVLDRVTA